LRGASRSFLDLAIFAGYVRINCFAPHARVEIPLDREAGRGKNRLAAAISNVSSACVESGRGRGLRPRACPVHCAYFEGQAVRTAVGVALLTVCLGLAGCSLFGKKQAARKDNPKPFLGSEAPAKQEIAALPRNNNGPLPGANGLLAGRVVVEATERPIRASILIKNHDREDAKTADLDFSTDDSGYFRIPNLNVGEHYELIVRAKDNGELISRTVWATPPHPTLLIRLDKSYTTASTPPPPDMPRLRDNKATAGAENGQDHKPTVSIDPPITLPDAGPQRAGGMTGPSPNAGPGANPVGGNPPNPANIADGGFHRIPQPPVETITIPNPPPPPQQPQWDSMPDPREPGRTAPAVPGSVRLPYIPTRVPSCVLLGNRLDNFALYDLNGEVWEYKRDRRGRLMLLDFWRHNCGPCLHCIPNLIELQRDFGPYGLDVIGIACETGTVEEQRAHVRPIVNRMGVNYRTLLSGGAMGRCPVMSQFQVESLPCLVLIDESGYIIYRSPRDGMSMEEHYVLKKKINDYLVARQSP
jgi:thiol-disulfide isomerase/thioredoxin